MMATLLVPTGALASSIRPGARPQTYTPTGPKCIVGEQTLEEALWEKCEVLIDETGVEHPIGKISTVVQWTTDEKPFNVGGAIVGGAAGAGVGFAAGLGSCAIIGPFCLLTATAIMQTGAGVGAGALSHKAVADVATKRMAAAAMPRRFRVAALREAKTASSTSARGATASFSN